MRLPMHPQSLASRSTKKGRSDVPTGRLRERQCDNKRKSKNPPNDHTVHFTVGGLRHGRCIGGM